MKIGNKSIIGMYVFSPDALYESGDFVIYKRSLYVCKVNKDTLELSEHSSYNPSNPIYFSPYPDTGVTENEIDQYIKDPDSSSDEIANKYITSLALSKLLQDHFYYGVQDGKLKKLDRSEFESENLNGDLTEIVQDIKVLSKIAENHGTSVFEIDYSVVKDEIDNPLISDCFSSSNTIYLFQIKFEDNKVIQQLINATTGFIAIREGSDGSWKSSLYDKNILSKINTVGTYLANQLSTIRSINSNLQNKFCFEELQINGNTIRSTDIDFTSKSVIVNMILQKEENSIKRNFTICLDLHECTENASLEENYYISDKDTIKCSYTEEEKSIKFTASPGIEIKNIYYRKKYNE